MNAISRPLVYSFISYKGGVGRTSLVVNTARALTLQGVNVLLIDLDLEGAGIPIFSSLEEPEAMFQPENIYPLRQEDFTKKRSLYDIWKDLPKKGDTEKGLGSSSIELSGILNEIPEAPRKPKDLPGIIRTKLSVYEYRSLVQQAPLEGRMFIVPAGGRFDLSHSSEQLRDAGAINSTKWIYHPLSSDKKEIKSMLSNEWMLDENLGFFSTLIDQTVAICNEVLSRDSDNTDAVNYVLLDERPGITPRGMIASTPSDGMVLLASGSRGNLAGVYDLLLAIQELIDPDDLKNSMFPPIVGLTIGPLLRGIKGGAQAIGLEFQALAAAIRYTDWGEVLEDLKKRRVIQSPNIEDFDKFEKLQKDIFAHTSYFQNAKINRINLWESFAHNDKNLREFCDTFIPYFFDESILIHDRVYNLRSYSKNGLDIKPSFDDEINSRSIIFLAGHLRSLNEKDADFRAWQFLYNAITAPDSIETLEENILEKNVLNENILEEGFEDKWSDLVSQGNLSWRYYWYYALWLERKGDSLGAKEQSVAAEVSYKRALENLKKAEELQRYVYRAYYPSWAGDWRIIFKKARLLSEIGLSDLSCKEYSRTLECLSKYPPSEQGEFKLEIAEINMLLAEIYIAGADYDHAWLCYQKVMEGDYEQPDRLAKYLYDLLDRSVSIEQDELRRRYEKILHYLKNAARGLRRFRGRIHYYLALFQYWYYRRMLAARSELEIGQDRLNHLDQVYKVLNESSSEEDAPYVSAESHSLLGEINLEYAYLNWNEPNKIKGQFFDALKNMLVAVAEQPENIKNHIYLAIARCLDSQYYKELPLSDVDIKELSTKERDAFYAFEQTVALCVNAKTPDNYFLEDEVKRLNQNLPTYIKLAVQRFQPDLYFVVNEWIDKMFPPDPNYRENAEYFAEILNEREKH